MLSPPPRRPLTNAAGTAAAAASAAELPPVAATATVAPATDATDAAVAAAAAAMAERGGVRGGRRVMINWAPRRGHAMEYNNLYLFLVRYLERFLRTVMFVA